MKEILDLKDRKILFELEQDSRQSLTQLSKKVGSKKETIFHRIKNLEKKGIIKKYLTEINVYKLGYQFYPMLVRYQNTTPQIEKEIFDYLKKSQYTAWLTTCEGAWNINLTLIAKGNFELKKFLDEFLENYSRYISDKHIFITTEIHYFKRGFWLNRKTQQTISTGKDIGLDLSKKDLQLLKILSTEARKPLVDIGKELKDNPKNIAYKIKKLEKDKIIQGSRILVDFSKIGYKYYKVWFSLKDVGENNFKELMNYFREKPSIIWATELIGFYDLSIEMEVKDVVEFRETLNEVKEKFFNLIMKHESLLIFEESVMNYLP
jgi:DNA-binding Lrp family transcriptional regulator